MTPQQAFERYTALLDLERSTGTRTTRVRNQLLQSLADDVLLEVALLIKKNGGAR